MSNPSLSKLGFNSADQIGHVLVKAMIQRKEEDEKGLSLRLVIHPRPEIVTHGQPVVFSHFFGEGLPEPAVERCEISRRIAQADVAEFNHPGNFRSGRVEKYVIGTKVRMSDGVPVCGGRDSRQCSIEVAFSFLTGMTLETR